MTWIIGILIVLLGVVGWGCWRAARAYLRFRGKRVVTCPETEQSAAVELAMWRIAITAAFREPGLRLRDCSRWRQRAPCDQACLAGIAASPEECLVLTILSKWYEGKTCTCCGRPVGQISHWRHKPCLMSPSMRIFEWKDIPSENIPLVLGTHAPVCWRCLVAETHIS
jgi:hypothetical protein